MTSLLDYAPIAAAGFAVPQFLPQIRRLAASGDTTGVSWSWAALTSVGNAAWIAYFALARYWTALIPSSSVTLLAGTAAVMLTRRRVRQALLNAPELMSVELAHGSGVILSTRRAEPAIPRASRAQPPSPPRAGPAAP